MLKNRVKETTTSTGTGAVVPAGAVAKFRSFAAAGLVTGDTFPLLIEQPTGEWEISVGTMRSDGTISRTFQDSSTGALLNLTGAAGTTLSLTIAASTFADLKPSGSATLSFGGGTVVAAGTYEVDVPYAATLTSLRYKVGSAGGSFTASISAAGAAVAGLSANVASAAEASVAPTGGSVVAASTVVAFVISAVTGSPTDARLVLTWGRN